MMAYKSAIDADDMGRPGYDYRMVGQMQGFKPQCHLFALANDTDPL